MHLVRATMEWLVAASQSMPKDDAAWLCGRELRLARRHDAREALPFKLRLDAGHG